LQAISHSGNDLVFRRLTSVAYGWRIGDPTQRSREEGGGLTALPQIAPDLCGRQKLGSRFGRLGNPRSTIESGSLQRALSRPGRPVIVISREMLVRGFGNLIFNSHDTQLHKI
jgi:hypothetical protein